MRQSRGMRVLLLASVMMAGCHSSPTRRSLASAEPALSPPVEGGTTVVEGTPPKTLTFVDRHPLFSKPREYYDSTGKNPIVKSAAAVVVGVPAGIYGELKQIVVGTPAASPY